MTESDYWIVKCPRCGTHLIKQKAEVGENGQVKQPPGESETTFNEFCGVCQRTYPFTLADVLLDRRPE